MLRELSIEEINKVAQMVGIYSDASELLLETATLIEKGEKIIVKEKTTACGTKINIYKYDTKLYRYILFKSIDLNI